MSVSACGGAGAGGAPRGAPQERLEAGDGPRAAAHQEEGPGEDAHHVAQEGVGLHGQHQLVAARRAHSQTVTVRSKKTCSVRVG